MWMQIKGWLLSSRSDSAPAGGAEGERTAARYLEQQGWKVLVRNWRNPKDRREEIDLVCRDGDVLVFVEVKARAASAKVPGYYAVNRRKKTVLLRACRAYLRRLQTAPVTYRFDVVEVATHATAAPHVLHFENVPLFP